jgi:holo-[acyl-carrier-protein] synthase
MIGIDIVEIGRIKDIYQRHGSLFLEKLLDGQEIDELLADANRFFFRKLSCYIASKEAIYKACADGDLGWKDIIIRNITNKPEIYIKKTDVTKKVKLSCTISRDMVISQALIIRPCEETMHERLSLSDGPIQPHSGVGADLSGEIDA